MAIYLIGDIQGCDRAFARLLATLDFSPSRDCLYALGDLVNRGPDSLGTLRRLMAFGDSARCLLGNHDLSLLALHAGLRRPHRLDTLDAVLRASDCGALMAWLKQQRMAIHAHGILMVHAGVAPQWTLQDTMDHAGEVESVLRGAHCNEFLACMYGNEPARWDDALAGAARLRVIVNALTRIRFCTSDGSMDLTTTGGLDAQPAGMQPWFDLPQRKTRDTVIAFGHWSTLGWLGRDDVIAMDSGCVWGGCLSALRLDAHGTAHERIQVRCPPSQTPGD